MKKALLFLVFVFSLCASFAQSVGIGTSTPDASAQLDVSASNKGFLPPRMSTLQRDAIQNPAPGLQVYNTTTDCLEIFSKGKWYAMFCAPASPAAPDSLTDIDGNSYATVKICDQTWMQKNLNVSRYRNGDIIPQVSNPSDWANLTTGAWCWYNNDSATYGSVYGRLYNWYAVNDPRGLAPAGWHVPSDGEWTTLTDCLGGVDSAGGKMKEEGTVHWNSPNTGATNSSGFNALPGGYIDPGGYFVYNRIEGIFWSSTSVSNSDAWYRYLDNATSNIYRGYNGYFNDQHKTDGFSIRCIKDTPITTLSNGLVAYYPFSGNAGDSSGNGNNLITNGSITYSNNHIGTSNSACYFSNGNNYFTTPNSSWTLINNLPKGTVSFWIKIDSQYTSNHYFGIGNSFMIKEEWGVGEDLFFGMQDGSTKVRMQITGVFPGSQSTDVFGNTSLAINTWNYIVGVWDGSYHTLYINGIQDGRISNPNGIPNRPNPAYFSIGTCAFGGNGSTSQPSGTYGSMSNLRFYNRALTQAEITYLANH